MSWLMSNWVALLSVVSAILSVGVMVAHILHKDSVAAQIQAVEDAVDQMAGKPKA